MVKNCLTSFFLPHAPGQFFSTLFEARAEWELDDLQVYVDYLVDETGIAKADLMLRYTKVTGAGTGVGDTQRVAKR